ncbi:histidinol-phosphate transaminase [Edaphobacillus lindanitolerans]|uniref:Histidinol-phosphate aminotransferase n=1 Tax=Edaphobacillus lindanitolerans TaxID=550447 RepID=A0A1U7PL16_9BACI|nr:histidinol-phosphate transaminase [Edaphobacillus lindanitolerans]SIT66436.1 histidinol-phosphate aminotransferase [Edaphobacillus lindanitolerans]
MRWNARLEGMRAYEPGKTIAEVKREYGLDRIVKLASNENPFGCPPAASRYLKEMDLETALYPDGYSTALRSALAEKLGVSARQLLFGSGSDEIIVILARALLSQDDNTVAPWPSFPQYRHNARIEGAELREIPLKDNRHDLDSMLRAIDENTSIVWLCSPNNPTGGIIPDDELRAFISRVPEHVLVVVDNAYHEYASAVDYRDPVDLIDDFPNVIVLRTFSKAYGLAALRVGYAVGAEAVISKLEPVRSPFNTTVAGQGAALAALGGDEFIRECREKNERGKEQYVNFARKHGLDCPRSEANFVLMEIRGTADHVAAELLKRGFIVRSGDKLGTPGYIRITVGTEEDNEALLGALAEVLAHSVPGA